MSETKSALEVFDVSFLLALSIVFMLVFNLAILNGGSATLYLDKYGEMMYELLILNFVVWPTISAGIYKWDSKNHE